MKETRIIKFINRVSEYVYDKFSFLKDKLDIFNIKKILKLSLKLFIFLLLIFTTKIVVTFGISLISWIFYQVAPILRGFTVGIVNFIVNYAMGLFYFVSSCIFIQNIIETKDYEIFNKNKYNNISFNINNNILRVAKTLVYILSSLLLVILSILVIYLLSIIYISIKYHIFIITIYLLLLLFIIYIYYTIKYILNFINGNLYDYYAIKAGICLIIGLVLSPLFFVETSKYKVQNTLPEYFKYYIETVDYSTKDINKIIVNSRSTVVLEEDKNLKESIKISYKNYDSATVVKDIKLSGNTINVNVDSYVNWNIPTIYKIHKIIGDSLKTKQFYNYSKIKYSSVTIYANKTELDKVKIIKK